MMFTINVEVRKEQGKGASRRLRVAGKFPAVIYGRKEAPVSIQLDHDTTKNLEVKPGFYGEVLSLIIEGKPTNVKVQAVQRHPFKPKLTHIDFIRV